MHRNPLQQNSPSRLQHAPSRLRNRILTASALTMTLALGIGSLTNSFGITGHWWTDANAAAAQAGHYYMANGAGSAGNAGNAGNANGANGANGANSAGASTTTTPTSDADADRIAGSSGYYGYPMVALGDSTMSLAPTTRRPNPFGSCHHYAGAWPQQVSQKLHLPLADLSCSGEVTASYWKKNLGPYLGPRTQLVVISYGSNDMRVVAQLATYNAHLGTGKKVQGRSRKDVEQSLITILKDVRKRAPNALSLTVGYLPLVQEKHCVNLPNMTPFENTRVRHLREAADQALTTASKTVARMSEQQWKDNGVEVVSAGISNVPFRQVHGHDLCAMGHKRFILNREKTGVRYHYTEPGLSYIADHVAWKYLSEQLQWSRQMVYLGR